MEEIILEFLKEYGEVLTKKMIEEIVRIAFRHLSNKRND